MTTEIPDQLEVYKFPSQQLKIAAKEFDFEVDGKEHDVVLLAHRLYGSMKKHNGLSIAATQCGIDFRIFVVDSGLLQTYDKDVLRPEIYINPVIIERSAETVRNKEGCLSYPKCTAMVRRNKSITVAYQDEFGVVKEQKGGGLFSIMVQHEIDHLNGLSLIDVVDSIERDKLYKQINKARK
jgi:peptide deformylase